MENQANEVVDIALEKIAEFSECVRKTRKRKEMLLEELNFVEDRLERLSDDFG